MEVIKHTKLEKGYFHNGLTIELLETGKKHEPYRVDYTIHEESRHMIYSHCKTYDEALSDFETLCVRYC